MTDLPVGQIIGRNGWSRRLMCVGMRPKLPPLVVGKRSHPGKIHFYVGPSCAMAEEMKGRVIGGEGKEAEVDGGYFGGYGEPANLKEDRIVRSAAAIWSLQCSTR